MSGTTIGMLIRQAMLVIGAWIAGKSNGIVTNAEIESFVGAAVVIGALVWRWIEAYRAAHKST